MDRKGIIAVALSIVMLVVWVYYNNIEMKKVAAAKAETEAIAVEKAAKDAASAPPSPAAPAPVAAATPAPAAPVTEPAVPEQTELLTSPSVDYTFSNLGGGITRALLKNHEGERGMKMVLNEFGAVPIGAIAEAAGEGTKVQFTAQVDAAGGAITFDRTDAKQLQLTKRFTVPQAPDRKSEYLVQLEATFTNRGAQPLTLPAYFIHTGSASQVHQSDLPTYTGFKWFGGKFVNVTSFQSGWWSGNKLNPVFAESHPTIPWAGVANQYFATLVTPIVESPGMPTQSGQYGVAVWAKRFDIPDAIWKESGRTSSGENVQHQAVDGALGLPAFTLEPGKSLTQRFQIYAGPREYGRLRLLPNDESDIMDLGMFAPISKLLLNSMNWLHGRLGTYAAAIVVLTLIIKTMLWPLQNKATNSMKRMQLLQPKMTELREKYKDDPTRMNTEVMKLYKDYGVNPMSGCLPMLVQIPIFFGFYNMLGKAVELRNSKFLWVQDLSQPDTIWHLPGLGWPVNILPLLMAVTMFWQMAISPKSGDPAQQRIFMFMPLIFIAFCYNFASALALYWTVQNLFSVVQLYATRNQAPPTLQKVTAPSKRK
jgi:YidC/Oxa1 family membrane protein insertase